jgi:hypothetical protein
VAEPVASLSFSARSAWIALCGRFFVVARRRKACLLAPPQHGGARSLHAIAEGLLKDRRRQPGFALLVSKTGTSPGKDPRPNDDEVGGDRAMREQSTERGSTA